MNSVSENFALTSFSRLRDGAASSSVQYFQKDARNDRRLTPILSVCRNIVD
jgi:hypothetical protein